MQRKFFDHRSRLTADLSVRYGVGSCRTAFILRAPLADSLISEAPTTRGKVCNGVVLRRSAFDQIHRHSGHEWKACLTEGGRFVKGPFQEAFDVPIQTIRF